MTKQHVCDSLLLKYTKDQELQDNTLYIPYFLSYWNQLIFRGRPCMLQLNIPSLYLIAPQISSSWWLGVEPKLGYILTSCHQALVKQQAGFCFWMCADWTKIWLSPLPVAMRDSFRHRTAEYAPHVSPWRSRDQSVEEEAGAHKGK